jgi:molybdopterin-guanine dinucleotide biosynthesis protein A
MPTASPQRRASVPLEEGYRGPAPAQVTGVLVCGGESRRMGEDKARLELAGRPLLAYPLAALREVAGRVVLASGAAPRYGELGLETVLDAFEGGGPLAGLLAGLEGATTEWVAVLACDLPRANAGALRALLAEAEREGLDVCLLELERGTQPLFGVYRRRCAEAVRAALEAGERRMVAFHGRSAGGAPLRVGSLGAGRLGGPELALNLNTPGELAAERARIGGAA